ncbi:uncharacterized protein LOC115889890 isoform X2 [Sitophilus oryzae]|uniref:hydroxyisourate hydrolase n=1 Tax=Sitophilus oryzae TaxID=7048 RepID=A0A6J2YRF9_SITOR|nr:uncharacterized protein LOC115889890 isoform X2 [Sitophilus oryzae]
MDSVTEVTHIIEEEEAQESEDLQDIESGSHINVIPLHLIKVSNRVQPTSEQFATVVRGKYSKYYKQTYRPAWEQMPDFKGWLRGVKGEPTRAYCIYCQKTLHAHRLSLLKHTCTIRHQKAAQLHGNPAPPKSFNISMDDNIQTVVNDENILTEEEDGDLQPQIIYTTQEELEDIEQEQETENELDEEEDDYYGQNISTSVQENSVVKNQTMVSPISTHVIDTTKGAPITGLSVSLYKLVDGRWTYINEGLTDTFGRFSDFIKSGNFSLGRYKLHYDVDKYFEAKKQESPFPFIEVVFDASSLTKHHFPLLLSPNSYTTYKSND